jgi:hypothetical protein
MSTSTSPVLRSLLSEAGYFVAVRSDGWFEVYLQRDAERWVGRGHTEEEAFAHLVAQMFPSRVSRMLLEAHVAQRAAASVGGDAEPDAAPAESARITISREAAITKSASASPEEVVPAPATLPPPAAEQTAPAPEPVAATEPVMAAAPEPAIAAQPAPVEAAPVLKVVEAAPAVQPAVPEKSARVRTQEALEAVEGMLAEIEKRLGQLARLCGERQRLNMLVWICRARAIEEAHPGAREVEHAVARVARRLTEIGKMFWPGSVRALQLSARPPDVRREMHANWASEPSNWKEATALAERLLDEHLSKSLEAGMDEDGWADAPMRLPRPADPDALFEEVDAELKALLVPPGEVPNGRLPELSSAELDRLMNAARKLRWLRGGVKDDVGWGVAMGRLRRSIPSLGDRAARVREIVEHRTKPPVPWAKVLGERLPDEPTSAPGESPAALEAALPAAHESKEALLAWLIRAFDVLNTPHLVALLVPFKAEVAALSDEAQTHVDRRVRRRLQTLLKKVAEAADAPPPAAPAEKEVEREVDETTDEQVAQHALDAIAARVRAQTQGRRTLFVSNREDPELGARLEGMLGITIAWCDGSLRRVQAMCERIKGGSYDLVLSATGFQVHGVDSALARACSAGNVPYVRVNRGRPAACIQAIAREFGLASGTFHVGAIKASSAD